MITTYVDYVYNSSCSPYNITLYPGMYLFELWGASGNSQYSKGGRGGYSKGIISFYQTTNIYIYIGGQGERGSNNLKPSKGGCNGGGQGGIGVVSNDGSLNYNSGSGGGGATDIRADIDSMDNRIIVAGGGGGTFGKLNEGKMIGSSGFAGGLYGGNGHSKFSPYISYGGNQTSGYKKGIGQDGRNAQQHHSLGAEGGGGSGGGWYGGLASNNIGASSNVHGSGGSSYVSGHPECIQNPYYIFTDFNLIPGNETFLSPLGLNETGHEGHGHARITYIGLAPSFVYIYYSLNLYLLHSLLVIALS